MENYDVSIVNIGDVNYMADVFRKIESEKKLNIVYLGGSITMGCNAFPEQKRYVNQSAEWWRESFPDSEVSFFNAGIGATTSQFGAARVDKHVLSKNPDLVFVEFSVNDSDNLMFMETYESLIRRLLKHDSVKAVILINNLFYDTGENAQGVHNAVGLHYNLPVVSVRDYIYPKLLLGEVKPQDYTVDMLHPENIGHDMIAALIKNLLDKEYLYYKRLSPAAVKPALKDKLTACRYEDCLLYNNLNCTPLLEGFCADKSHSDEHFSVPFKNGWTASKIGDSITFTLVGNIIAIQWKRTVNQPAPIAYAVIDGDEDKKIILDSNFEETWGDLCCLTTLTENAGNGSHTLKITIDRQGKPDSDFMLISVICADKF